MRRCRPSITLAPICRPVTPLQSTPLEHQSNPRTEQLVNRDAEEVRDGVEVVERNPALSGEDLACPGGFVAAEEGHIRGTDPARPEQRFDVLDQQIRGFEAHQASLGETRESTLPQLHSATKCCHVFADRHFSAQPCAVLCRKRTRTSAHVFSDSGVDTQKKGCNPAAHPFRISAIARHDMTRGQRDLLAWLDRCWLQDQQLAAELCISRAYLSQILRGRRRPGLDLAARLHTLTGIPPLAWTDTLPSRVDQKTSGDRRRKAGTAANTSS